MNSLILSTSTQKTNIPVKTLRTTKVYTWLDHAERHFKNGQILDTDMLYGPDEQLMYLCLFSHVGMFEYPLESYKVA